MADLPSLEDTSVAQFLALPLDRIVAGLPFFLASYVEVEAREEIVDRVQELRKSHSMAQWGELLGHMYELGEGFGFYRRNALASEIANAYMMALMRQESSLLGVEHLDRVMSLQAEGRRVMIFGNHLSYADTMALRQLLGRCDREDALKRLTALAGPKVYSEPMRRLAVAGIHSIKVAQSSRLSTNEVELSPREIMRISRDAMSRAEELMDEGHLVLIYPEGTRSRSGRLEPFLRATNRWLSLKDVVLIPLAIWGSENLYVLDSDQMRSSTCHARFGPSLDTRLLREDQGMDRDGILAEAHAALARLLPEDYHPLPDSPVSV